MPDAACESHMIIDAAAKLASLQHTGHAFALGNTGLSWHAHLCNGSSLPKASCSCRMIQTSTLNMQLACIACADLIAEDAALTLTICAAQLLILIAAMHRVGTLVLMLKFGLHWQSSI